MSNDPTPARDAVERTKDLEALVLHMYASPDMYSDELIRYRVTALITAARADERAQLAARATDQERGMVRAYGVAECQATVHAMRSLATENRIERLVKVTVTETTLLAALTASRERGAEGT